MSLEQSKAAFLNILNTLDGDQLPKFLSWIKKTCCTDLCASNAYFHLRTIAQDIKTLIPLNAVFDSEKVLFQRPRSICGSDDVTPVLHVDSFLNDDDDVDALVEQGLLSRNYCKNCSSTDVSPIIFVSYSIALEGVIFIFQHLLPNLDGKTVLDVGSRLGSVLYGAYYCSQASRIVGIEFNEDLCKLQDLVIKKYGMNDRIQVICEDICNLPEVVEAADVVILNNVFECFLPVECQVSTWRWLRERITKTGAMLVTSPSLEKSLGLLQTGIELSSWVREVQLEDPVLNMKMEELDISEIHVYIVL